MGLDRTPPRSIARLALGVPLLAGSSASAASPAGARKVFADAATTWHLAGSEERSGPLSTAG